VLPGDDAATLITPQGAAAMLAGQGIGPHQVEVLRAVVYSHHVRFADRWRAGRVFLAGDAAHVMPPWIGQGMASGVRDVDNLCWKLAAALDPRLPAQDAGRLLDSYETERMPTATACSPPRRRGAPGPARARRPGRTSRSRGCSTSRAGGPASTTPSASSPGPCCTPGPLAAARIWTAGVRQACRASRWHCPQCHPLGLLTNV
jgi:2-polyprenyl-6-methoxyphenol hydroxylase-like FAD-dependent oxidoreductase